MCRDAFLFSLKNQLVKGLKIFPQLVDPIGTQYFSVQLNKCEIWNDNVYFKMSLIALHGIVQFIKHSLVELFKFSQVVIILSVTAGQKF